MTAESTSFPSPAGDDPLLTKKNLADRWQCSVSFIEKRQPAELPPRCWVIPGQARYRLSDILRFEASRVDQSHTVTAAAMDPNWLPFGPVERLGSGFPIRLPVTVKTERRRSGRRPVPAIREDQTG
jgi:hypothetical protein